MHPAGGSIVWTCADYDIIEGKEECNAIRPCGFSYKLFKNRNVGM